MKSEKDSCFMGTIYKQLNILLIIQLHLILARGRDLLGGQCRTTANVELYSALCVEYVSLQLLGFGKSEQLPNCFLRRMQDLARMKKVFTGANIFVFLCLKLDMIS